MTTFPRIHTVLTVYRSLRRWQFRPPFNSSGTRATNKMDPRRTLNNFARLLSVAFVAALSFAIHAAEVREYQVSVPGVTYGVMVRVPGAFRPAANAAEAAGRKTLKDNLQTNSKGKATMSEIFSTDWTHPATPPLVCVGTLPALVPVQGNITADYWRELKEMFTEKANMEAATVRQQMLTHGLADPGDTMKRAMAAADGNTIIIFGSFPTGKASAAPTLLIARKFKYVRKSIVVIEASVDAAAPGAMATLDHIIRTVDAP